MNALIGLCCLIIQMDGDGSTVRKINGVRGIYNSLTGLMESRIHILSRLKVRDEDDFQDVD